MPTTAAGKPAKKYVRRFIPHRRVCSLCVEKVATIDYKDVARLKRFVTERGRIVSRRKTGTCARHQRPLTLALKRARHIALLPFTAQQAREMEGLGIARG